MNFDLVQQCNRNRFESRRGVTSQKKPENRFCECVYAVVCVGGAQKKGGEGFDGLHGERSVNGLRAGWLLGVVVWINE